MNLSIPLLTKEKSLAGDWFRIEHGANTASVNCSDGRLETLIYVIFGDDFIAGLRVDRKTWILLPARSVSSVTFSSQGANWLPPVRQTSDSAREYLQGLGRVYIQIWPIGRSEPLPPARADVQGSWFVLSRADDDAAERLVSFDSTSMVEVLEMDSRLNSDNGWKVQ